MQPSHDDLAAARPRMRGLRSFEEAVHARVEAAWVPGPTRLSDGQGAVAVCLVAEEVGRVVCGRPIAGAASPAT